jgi:hypothetical protein
LKNAKKKKRKKKPAMQMPDTFFETILSAKETQTNSGRQC